MIDSTNPRCMADNIRHLSGASGSQASDISDLQTAVGTLQTTVGTQGNAIEALQTYDDTETDTGMKWIDGSSIYRKVFDVTALPNNDTDTVGTITDFKEAINAYFVTKPTASYGARVINYYGSMYVIVNQNGSVDVHTNTNLSGVSAYVVVEYIKTAPEPEPESNPEAQTSPSPEDETRSAHDPEISDPIERSEEPSDEIIEEPIVETKTTRKRSTSTK